MAKNVIRNECSERDFHSIRPYYGSNVGIDWHTPVKVIPRAVYLLKHFFKAMQRYESSRASFLYTDSSLKIYDEVAEGLFAAPDTRGTWHFKQTEGPH